MIRDQLVVQELLFQRAQSTGYTKKEELKAQADKAAQTVYIRAMMGDYMKSAVRTATSRRNTAVPRPRWRARKSTTPATSSSTRRMTPRP